MKDTTRYPWHLAPKNATHAATDKDGTAWWFFEPFIEDDAFVTDIPVKIKGRFVAADWQKSLEARPKEPQAELTQTDGVNREKLRAKLAGKALKGMLQNGALGTYDSIASNALSYADAVLNKLYPAQ